jgi:hypothetical protein
MSDLLSIYLMQTLKLTMLPVAQNFHCPPDATRTTIPPMGSRLSLALLLPLAALFGCGGATSSPPPSNTSTQPTYDFNGSWTAVSEIYPAEFPFSVLNANLQATNGSVTGTITPSTPYGAFDPDPCPANNTSVAVTGSLDADNDLTLSFPIAGGTGTLFAVLAENPQTYSVGTWQVVGGPCAMSTTLMAIVGAPSTPYTPASPAPTTANLSGGWRIVADYTLPNGTFQYTYPRVNGFDGVLQFANGAVSGTLAPFVTSGCTAFSPIAVTGAIDANSNLTLTLPVGGGTATITATLGTNLQALADGSFKIVGGSCATPATPMTIAQFTPVAGTYTGTFSVSNSYGAPVPGTIVTLTTVLSQSSTPDASGTYPVTGTYTVTGGCTDSGSLTGLTADPGFISNSSFTFFGNVSPSGDGIYNAVFSSTKCTANYQGTLTRQ